MTNPRARRARLPVFTPTVVDPDELLERTVGREDVIDRIGARIAAAATSDDRPHVLVVGPRGSGKTHLLRVVVHRALSDETTASRVVAVTLPEDAPEVVSYPDLLFAVIQRLAAVDPARVADLVDAARAQRRDATALESIVLSALGDRVLLLVIENLDRIFDDLGPADQGRLRAFTETSGRVMLLASTPLLFEAVSDHAQPWYGAFGAEVLDDLDIAQGAELLRRLALVADDEKLAHFLETPAAFARLQAVTHLAGGSPRIWMVLACCLTVEVLDELVPLATALLDELVPYYQERLGSLGRNERKLVVELCRTSQMRAGGNVQVIANGMRTATDLADACGLDRASATTSLNRLLTTRWVRRSKIPGTDQRITWYEIREPMLRHHLQYRSADSEGLEMIVGFLREWYSLAERRRYLAGAEPQSIAEKYLVDAIVTDAAPLTTARRYASGDPHELLADARLWLDDHRQDSAGGVRSQLAAIAAEVAVIGVLEDAQAANVVLERRIAAAPTAHRVAIRKVATAAVSAVGTEPPTPTGHANAVRGGLLAAYAALPEQSATLDRAALALMTVNWIAGLEDFVDYFDLIEHIRPVVARMEDEVALQLAIEDAGAFLTMCVGRPEEARNRATTVLRRRIDQLGPHHPDTLDTKRMLASWAVEADRPTEASELCEELFNDLIIAAGAEGHEATILLLLAGVQAYEAKNDLRAARLLEAVVASPVRVAVLQPLEHAAAHRWLAVTYSRIGRLDDAVASAHSAISLIEQQHGRSAEGAVTGRLWLGRVLDKAGRSDAATTQYVEALAAARAGEPIDPHLLEEVYYSLGDHGTRMDDPQLALRMILTHAPEGWRVGAEGVAPADQPWFTAMARLLIRPGMLAQIIEHQEPNVADSVRSLDRVYSTLVLENWATEVAGFEPRLATTAATWIRDHDRPPPEGLLSLALVQAASWLRSLPSEDRAAWLALWSDVFEDSFGRMSREMISAMFSEVDGDPAPLLSLRPELRNIVTHVFKSDPPPDLIPHAPRRAPG